MTTITRVSTHDLRARTSKFLHGSDANHPDPDYSAAYVVLHTDGALEGHGMTFTIGAGNDLCCVAIEALAPAFNPRAFTDGAKVDKWFRRNCKDVLQRECSATEKADVLAFLLSFKP